MKLGIVVSETYWDDITKEMLKQSLEAAKDHDTTVIKVPGSFDIPLAVKKLLPEVDGVITLGAIVEGETDHDGMISYVVGKALIDLSLEFMKPVVCGINGPKMSRQQGIARISRAEKVTLACIKLIGNLK